MEALLPVLEAVAAHYRHGQRRTTTLPLTPREIAVLQLLANGFTSPAIARRLRVSPRTVQKHLEHCYRKLEVRDKVSAVRVATDAGLLCADGVEPLDEDAQLF